MVKDQAYEKDLHESPRKSIRSGFFWLGIASIIAQILSALTMIIAMVFLTKSEMGTATLALSFSVIFEAFNSLGTNRALLQTKELTQDETHSVFWFASGFGILMFLVAVPLAWPVATFYKLDALIPLFIIAMLKLPLVSIAGIPLQLVNRRLEYRKLSILNTVTTLFCSILKIVLAILGCGAWALVIGDTAFGAGTLIGAFILSRYRPKLHFKFHECKRFIRYGVKHCIFNALDQFNRNLHYLIVGKFLGEGVLGIYRVAYELAMTPAMALFDVVAKSSFPVFSRIQDKRTELTSLFSWNQRNIALFAAVPTIFILFCAHDIFELFPNSDWLMATPVIPFVLALSFMRSVTQSYPELYRACGKPEYPIYICLAEMGMIVLFCSAALMLAPQNVALQFMVGTWVCILIILLIVHSRVARHFVDSRISDTLSSTKHGIGILLLASLFSVPLYLFATQMHFHSVLHIAVEVCVILVSLWIYAKYVLKLSLREVFNLSKKKNTEKQEETEK